MQNIIKVLVAAAIIIAVTEIGRRLPKVGGLILSLPLTSIIALVWLYIVGRNAQTVATLSWNTFWFVIPSLLLFVLLPLFLHRGIPFWIALLLSSVTTAAAYWSWPFFLSKFGIKI